MLINRLITYLLRLVVLLPPPPLLLSLQLLFVGVVLAAHTGVGWRLLELVTLGTLLLRLVVVNDDVVVSVEVEQRLICVDADEATAAGTAGLMRGSGGGSDDWTQANSSLPVHVTASRPNQDEEYLSYVRVNYITGQTRAAQVVTAIPKRLSRITH